MSKQIMLFQINEIGQKVHKTNTLTASASQRDGHVAHNWYCLGFVRFDFVSS